MAIRAHYFQAAATILQALLERTDNKVPNEAVHAHQAVEWVQLLVKASNDDPVLVMSAARLVAGFMKNPQSAHCNKHELLHYAITGVRNLASAFSGGSQSAAMVQAPVASAWPNIPVTTSVPQPQAPPPPQINPNPGPPQVFMPPPAQFTPGAPGPFPPPAPAPIQETDGSIPDFSDLGGMR